MVHPRLTVCLFYALFFFFFSSRRRHTRFDCDWSSDVCSSDLSSLRRMPDTRSSDSSAASMASMHCQYSPSSRAVTARSEEHTSELQSQSNLVCRLLLEKKTIQRMLVTTPLQ